VVELRHNTADFILFTYSSL